MTKLAIVIFADTDTAESMGRVANAFVLANEAIESKADLKLIFEGAGTKWIPTLEDENHKLHGMYAALKPQITGACKFCSQAFGVKSAVEKAGVQLLGEYKDHPSLLSLIDEGFQIVSF
ncbi:DsrE family protein [Perlabentimonas gracilis]|uniref:DsrE family protein n=1 Tax=Perlabentimonas gracilis TaxID=2715279 RepID=UPI00140E176A|nr:DsrE family protein [Perlabentimonas gracilis]NHB70366.1 hypothetical protein [Perlabentimonas gracilis]